MTTRRGAPAVPLAHHPHHHHRATAPAPGAAPPNRVAASFCLAPSAGQPRRVRQRPYLNKRKCQWYWDNAIPVPWSDMHLFEDWHLNPEHISVLLSPEFDRVRETKRGISITFLTRYRSGACTQHRTCDQKCFAGRRSEGPQPAAALGCSRLYSVDSRCPPVGFGSQHILARPVGPSSTSTTSPSTSEMADGTPVTYEELPDELKKRYDEIKVTLEADLIGSFQRTRSHGIEMEGVLTARCTRWDRPICPVGRTRSLRQEINYWWLTRYTATREPGQHVGACHNIRDFGKTGGTSAELEKQTWLTKYATPTNLQSPAPAVGSELEKQAWLAKCATPANLQSSTPAASTADQISTILRDQFGMVPKRRAIGYSKPYPDDYEMIPLPPKYRLPDFSKFSGSDGSSSIEHVGRYLAQLGPASVSDQLRVRFFSQSLTGSAFGWYTSLPPDSIRSWKQLEEQFHTQYH
ncbi:hypothetical protein QYE76_008487 [Lolium multiflorum]|uniref:Retrotransposon gag domain-containing protein n=1 Tax=Lolium multiflorum TaxID=4521 RepID=A0AAD8X0X8_LOLMU|nr:hypothetical protein QYE76_008487 [Lolium multiflorum]